MNFRYLLVRSGLAILNVSFVLKKMYGQLAQWGLRLRRRVCAFVGLPAVLTTARLLCKLGLMGRVWKNRAAIASANYKALIGDDRRPDFVWPQVRRELMEEGLTTYGAPKLMAQLQDAVAQLNEVIAPIQAEGTPVVLAPLHMVSDTLAGMVAGLAKPGKATIIVSSSAMRYTAQDMARGGLDLTYCSIHQGKTNFASSLVDSLGDVIDGKRNLILFPDITPEYTDNTTGVSGSKLRAHVFGRVANLHNGSLQLGRILQAKIVYFYLYTERNDLKIHIYEPMTHKQARTQMPLIFEEAIRQYPEDWVLWHNHSLFYI